MNPAEEKYTLTGRALPAAMESQMFGKPCFKVNGKAFVSFFDDCMVFKLSGKPHEEAMSLDGAKLFDPSRKGRPMKEWVQMPEDYADRWGEFTQAAFEYVREASKG